MKVLLLAALLTTSLAPVLLSSENADYVLTNGKVFTVDRNRPWARAVAVKGDRIVCVGSDVEAGKFIGKDTRTVDLKGRLVLPGFVESHIHLMMGAAISSGLLIEQTDSVEDIRRKLGEYVRDHPDRKVVFGASYNAFLFGEKGPDKAVLDAVVPDRPVLLMDHTLHSAWCNSRALEIAGITKETRNPPGGEYVRGADGSPTGFIKGSPASLPVIDAIGAVTPDSFAAKLPDITKGLSEFGFTSAMDFGNPVATEAGAKALTELDRAGKLPLRVSLMYFVNTPALAEGAVRKQEEYARKYRSGHVWYDTMKIVGDSVLQNQKAALLEPYLTTGGTGDRGSLYFDAPAIAGMASDAADHGQSVAVHAVGDRAGRTALDAAETVRKSGHTGTRFIITHAELVDPADRPRFAGNNVILQTTGNWANYQPAVAGTLGEKRYNTLQFPFRTLWDSGVTLALGADWPATPGGFKDGVNPFNNIYTAMHRRPPKDLIAEFSSEDRVLEPAREVLTLEEAVRAYTINGARQMGLEKETGSIVVGKKADMILLDRNLFAIPPEEIPKTKVLATMFEGRLVHDIAYGIGDSHEVDPAKISGSGDSCVCRP